MKTLITTMAIGLTLLNARASHNNSALKLKMFDNGMFTVLIDNSICMQTNVFSTQNIQPGYHQLKVTRHFQNPFNKYQASEVVYKGWINIPPKSVVYAQIDCHRQFDVVKIAPYCCPAVVGNFSNNNESYACGYGTDCGYEENGAVGIPTIPIPMCMSHLDYMQLRNSIKSKSFESSRMQMTKQALLGNYFTSVQVTGLMQLFSFESNRLELAKFAYSRVLDKQNYYLVNASFNFENSIGELNQYIAMGK